MKFSQILLLILLIIIIFICTCTVNGDKDVIGRRLISEKPSAKSILKENERYSADNVNKRNFDEMVLAYVTPWNNHGYDIAKIFNDKFTHVSPVWYQIRIDKDSSSAYLTGQHDVDKGWLEEVRSNKKTKIVPRFLAECIYLAQYNTQHNVVWHNQQLFDREVVKSAQEFLSLFAHQENLFKLLVGECLKQGFDGLALDGFVSVTTDTSLHPFIKGLGDALHTAGLEFIFVIPPKQGDRIHFGADDFEALVPSVDGFSLMSYDYSNAKKPGPTSPIEWMRDCVEELLKTSSQEEEGRNKKIMLGLNFYGYDYVINSQKGGAIVGSTYLGLLKKHKPKIYWDSVTEEHIFTYEDGQGSHKVYFPTLKSIHERIKLAKELGVSLSIWEVGQGLDYFYDLL